MLSVYATFYAEEPRYEMLAVSFAVLVCSLVAARPLINREERASDDVRRQEILDKLASMESDDERKRYVETMQNGLSGSAKNEFLDDLAELRELRCIDGFVVYEYMDGNESELKFFNDGIPVLSSVLSRDIETLEDESRMRNAIYKAIEKTAKSAKRGMRTMPAAKNSDAYNALCQLETSARRGNMSLYSTARIVRVEKPEPPPGWKRSSDGSGFVRDE